MADIELVIKISEKTVNEIRDNAMFAGSISSDIRWDVTSAIVNGTPLTKGHGRLIDAREYENSIRKHYFDNSTVIRCTEIALDNAPTVIEADKESKDADSN